MSSYHYRLNSFYFFFFFFFLVMKVFSDSLSQQVSNMQYDIIKYGYHAVPASQVALVVKSLPANAGDKRCRFNPWVGKTPWREGVITHSSILA